MTNTFIIKKEYYSWLPRVVRVLTPEEWIVVVATILACLSTVWSFYHGYIAAYGDAESHLNIAKRVVDSLTPGFAQLGGIWLPLPHLLLIPFVYFDSLWHTGLAGSIVSGIAYIISALFIFKLARLFTNSTSAAMFASFVFMLNPNVLYLQSTPMTELTLIVFFILSTYCFLRFLRDDTNLLMLIGAAFFGFCASLSRYDGWALVMMEAGVLFLYYLPITWRSVWNKLTAARPEPPLRDSFRNAWGLFEGRLVLFGTLAFFGIALWLFWGFLILGDPLYFTHSQFSANSQQMSWLARGELPAYHNVGSALLYYFLTALSSGGIILSLMAIIGMFVFYFSERQVKYRSYMMLVLLVPFFFNVLTLFLGQSVIFLPGLTPITFEWTLFNVRYGVMMVPFVALFAGYLYYRSNMLGRIFVVSLVALQCVFYSIGYSPVLALNDGVSGLSSATAKIPDAQFWLASHYDYGMVLTDDFARTISIIRTPIPMHNIIYIGNKPYWEESLVEPQKYARWIVMQRNDDVWKNINDRPEVNARLYAHFQKVYTSEDILIFKRNDNESTPTN